MRSTYKWLVLGVLVLIVFSLLFPDLSAARKPRLAHARKDVLKSETAVETVF